MAVIDRTWERRYAVVHIGLLILRLPAERMSGPTFLVGIDPGRRYYVQFADLIGFGFLPPGIDGQTWYQEVARVRGETARPWGRRPSRV